MAKTIGKVISALAKKRKKKKKRSFDRVGTNIRVGATLGIADEKIKKFTNKNLFSKKKK